MALRTTPHLTDTILAFFTEMEDIVDIPRSMRRVVYQHEYEHWKQKKRIGEEEKRERKRVREALWRMEKAELISRDGKKRAVYRLTPKGWITFAQKYAKAFWNQDKEASSRKDITTGSYVIIFDIPEVHRRFRDVLRQVLLNLGCTPLQKSIFQTHNKQAIQIVARVIANCELEDRVKILLVKSVL